MTHKGGKKESGRIKNESRRRKGGKDKRERESEETGNTRKKEK